MDDVLFTLPALNYANIVILRHLKQEVLAVDADLSVSGENKGMLQDH